LAAHTVARKIAATAKALGIVRFDMKYAGRGESADRLSFRSRRHFVY